MTLLRHFSFSRRKPVVKNIVNVIFWTFVTFGVYLLLIASESFWEYPRFQGAISFLSAFFIVLPFLVYRATRLREWYREHFVYASEILIAFPLSLNGLGAIFFFDASWGFDSLMHFVNSALAVFLIFLVLGAFWKTDTLHTRIVLFFLAVAGSFFFGALIEAWERFSDFVFATHTWGEAGQDPLYDTAVDFFYDALGTGFAGLALFFWGRAWLFRLRRASPRIRAAALKIKREVKEHVRERVDKHTEQLRTLGVTMRATREKTKKRLRERREKLFRARSVINPSGQH